MPFQVFELLISQRYLKTLKRSYPWDIQHLLVSLAYPIDIPSS
jgi:hypothetical protein